MNEQYIREIFEKYYMERRNEERKKMLKKILIMMTCILFLIPLSRWAVSVAKPYAFSSGTAVNSSQVNANFDALFTKVNELDTRLTSLESGGKSWKLICEIDITSATTSFNTGDYGCNLNGNTDVEYNIITKIQSSAGGGSMFLIFPNNDSVGGNYFMQGLYNLTGQGTNVYGDPANYGGIFIGNTAALNELIQSNSFFYAKSGKIRNLAATVSGRMNSGTLYAGLYSTSWLNTSSNITNLQFLATAVNGIGPDSHFEIWARR
ncbi:MAG TPA: hypothetical protein PK453_03045 [Leptospiraceae bacterium]|nr:hypothetical protein [Leptospiraceae bacterium]HMY66516.1 hypothetical protein [Leptospiraceae bacterium]HNF12620.1 hypothetical protein [Leptospiraceae bacterium]HNF23924.1 hypothetical protein [Leptospiraceae bacterium]HNI95524.1 hypothetical protein [Leptospiraceae bacterium]